MDVVHLIDDLPTGGAQSLLLDLVSNTSEQHTIYYIGERDQMRPAIEQHANVVGLGGQFRFDPRAIIRFMSMMNERRPDVLHTHLPYAHVVGRWAQPFVGGIVATYHNVSQNYFKDWKLSSIERLTSSMDDVKVACSHGVQSSYKKDNNTWQTIPNGIDVDGFAHRVRNSDTGWLRNQYNIDSDIPVLLNVGRYVPQKKQAVLIRAMEQIVEDRPDIHLLIVGRGPLEEQLRGEVRELGLEKNITVTGRVDDIHAHYALADIFVLPSEFEGLPITILEAMTAQCTIVASDIPGIREVVTHGEIGILTQPNSVDSLIEGIRAAVNEQSGQYVDLGIERVQAKYSIERMVDDYEQLYASLT
jgi:glycosyltransferase involved in cell wall biosynthesis